MQLACTALRWPYTRVDLRMIHPLADLFELAVRHWQWQLVDHARARHNTDLGDGRRQKGYIRERGGFFASLLGCGDGLEAHRHKERT